MNSINVDYYWVEETAHSETRRAHPFTLDGRARVQLCLVFFIYLGSPCLPSFLTLSWFAPGSYLGTTTYLQ